MIFAERTTAEQRIRFGHQPPVAFQLVAPLRQQVRAIGHDQQLDILIQRFAMGVDSRQHGGIDQRADIDAAEMQQ